MQMRINNFIHFLYLQVKKLFKSSSQNLRDLSGLKSVNCQSDPLKKDTESHILMEQRPHTSLREE